MEGHHSGSSERMMGQTGISVYHTFIAPEEEAKQGLDHTIFSFQANTILFMATVCSVELQGCRHLNVDNRYVTS